MKKSNKKNNQFNLYWIYAIIAVFFIGLQFFHIISNPLQKINKKQFFTEFLIEGDVEKVTIVNNEFVEVFIKSVKLEKNKHKNIQQNKIRSKMGPHYYFNITSGEKFENDLKEFYLNNQLVDSIDQIFPDVETRKDVFGEMISWLIPIFIMLFIWLYIMRRMNSGGGGPGLSGPGLSDQKRSEQAFVTR